MIWLLLILLTTAEGQQKHVSKGRQTINLCRYSRNIINVVYEFPRQPKNQYTLNVRREIEPQSNIILLFNSPCAIKLIEPTNAILTVLPSGHSSFSPGHFKITFTEKTSRVRIQVSGMFIHVGYSKPYIEDIVLNGEKICKYPTIGFLDDEIEFDGYLNDDGDLISEKRAAESFIGESCGRRKVVHTELIVHGQPTQPGDWPWHAAILRADGLSLSYICGGTLLSKTLVLTAAHCASINGNPVVTNSLSIVLGKYNLIGEDKARQERSVFEVIVHPAFEAGTLMNDIALLKLKSEAVYTDYVQPACLWYTGQPTEDVVGTVVGWGFNHSDKLSPTLQQITVPIVSELTCLKSNPIFFHRNLNINKFCAGFTNGSSICNGDSGGGLMVFVPDPAGDTDKASGAWYVRGIVSLAARRSDLDICDPYQYTIFTDVEKYRDWVIEHK